MSEEKFQDAAALKAWLIGNDVDPEKAPAVCQTLFDKGYNLPSTLIGISFEELTGCGIGNPVARHISNKLKEQQQPNGKLRCCSRIHFVFSVLFDFLSILSRQSASTTCPALVSGSNTHAYYLRARY
jgi:hypothetical protein